MKKKYRLKKNHEIAMIVQKRQRISKNDFTVYYQYTKEGVPQVALSVSKKLGNAVVRNKIKRRIREIIRPFLATMSQVKMVIVAREGIYKNKFESLKKELDGILLTIISRKKGE